MDHLSYDSQDHRAPPPADVLLQSERWRRLWHVVAKNRSASRMLSESRYTAFYHFVVGVRRRRRVGDVGEPGEASYSGRRKFYEWSNLRFRNCRLVITNIA